ncbi:MAG: DUF1801 domain-containing protein [Saprospiraceae bacterium]|nr:DUF1801 domain-containing protein [Saprospiraceae bacterium]
MTQSIDVFFTSGCGRCGHFDTPQCKVHNWRECLLFLRDIVLSVGLEEQVKWGFPCYTLDNKNVVMLGALKDYCNIAFFKGALLENSHGLLIKAGENSQSAMQIRFTHIDQIAHAEGAIRDYIKQAVAVEKSVIKVAFPQKEALVFPQELLTAFASHQELEKAFHALTPGRQRGYILFFTGAKQSATRVSRIQKVTQDILKGKGMHD